MGLNDLLTGKELIVKQTSCVKDLPSKGLKEFRPNDSWLERKQIQNQLEEQFRFIGADRIEKSTGLSQAEWVPELKKAKVTRKVGKSWDTLGHHQDNHDWLLPEEVLFLIENCELQLMFENVSVSVEDCYRLVLSEGGCSLAEYRVFSYLCRAGLRVVRHCPSVSVTRYEKQVKLDAVVQTHKRPPPVAKSMDRLTLIDDDICIIEETPRPSRSSTSTKPTNNLLQQTIVLIESDEDEIKEIESDSDSDVICISSPSYCQTDKTCRSWYPVIGRCLVRSIERVIDLCDEENELHENKFNVRTKLELIRPRKEEILSNLPTLDGGVTSVVVADRRLLPTNAAPKYSEYKVNLNVRPDDTFTNTYNNENFSHFNRPTGPQHVDFNCFDTFSMNQNPLLMKAQQMQAMAMSMIQTATQLMSFMSTTNPNELWELYPNRGIPVSPYNGNRFGSMSRPYQRQFGYQRRPRFQRRRFPYRKPQHYSHRFAHVQSNSEVVVLSDGEDITGQKCNGNSNIIEISTEYPAKRKLNSDSEIKKRTKYETGNDEENTRISDSSSCIFDGEIENFKKEPEDIRKKETDVIVKKESNVSIKKETNVSIKKETNNIVKDEVQEEVNKSTAVKSESDSVDTGQETVNSDNSPCATIRESQDITEKASSSQEFHKEEGEKSNPGVTESFESSVVRRNSSSPEKTCRDPCREGSLGEPVAKGASNLVPVAVATEVSGKDKEQQVEVSAEESVEVGEDSLGDREGSAEERMEADGTNLTQSEELASWVEYKQREDEEPEGFPEDSLFSFDQATSYGHVLSTLKIFKQIETNKVKSQFKISYDAYLPDSNFKKSLKVLPNYRIIILKPCEEVPTSLEMASLKTEYQDKIPFLFCVVFSETFSFYLYDNLALPTFSD